MPKLVLAMALSRRFPKDFAATLMTAATAECLIAHDGMQPHSWEAAHYESKKRGYGSGTKTRGTLARSRSGYCTVCFRRLAEWEAGRPPVTSVARSLLWSLLRDPVLPEKPTTNFFAFLEPQAFWVVHVDLIGFPLRARTDETIAQALAACQSFDAIAALWALVLEEEMEGRHDMALTCAQYLPPALAFLSCTTPGWRVALPAFARIRQSTLDGLKNEGQALRLADYDLPAVARSAQLLERPEFIPVKRLRRPAGKLEFPEATLEWVKAHRAPVEPIDRPRRTRAWRPRLSPMSHPQGPCHSNAFPHYHPKALARMHAALGRYT
jgi:hypothetical protein